MRLQGGLAPYSSWVWLPVVGGRCGGYDYGMKKIAIALTDQQADAIERIRQQRGLPRSRVIRQALDLYLASHEAAEEADRAYEAGYRAKPEQTVEAEAYTRTAGEVLAPEEWE